MPLLHTKANIPTFDDSSCRLSRAPRPTRRAGRQTRPADSASRRTVFVNILICHWWKWRWIRDRICSFSFAKFSHKRLFCWEKNYTLNTRSILSVWYILFSGLVHGSKSKYLRNKLTKLDPTILEQTSQEFVYILTVSQSIECIK